MAYDLMLHPLLSEDAADLDGPTLRAQQRVAERLLGLFGTDYLGSAKDAAQDALAMQVSLQVAADPEAYLVSMSVRGSRTVVYKAGGVKVHPLALEIVERLLALDLGDEGAFGVITSLR